MIVRQRVTFLATDEVADQWAILLDEREQFLAMAPANHMGPTIDQVGPLNVCAIALSSSVHRSLMEAVRNLGPLPGVQANG